jgi:hypothetical protein
MNASLMIQGLSPYEFYDIHADTGNPVAEMPQRDS